MKIIVLDRDGVINEDRDDFVKNAAEWVILDGAANAIANLTQGGWRVVVATNQSGLGRGLFDMEALNAMHEKMLRYVHRAGGRIDGIFFCPHHPDEQCQCRKPAPGMLLDIAARFGVRPESLTLIGDSLRDLEAVVAVGGQPILVKTGKGAATLRKGGLPDHCPVFADLAEAAEWLMTRDIENNGGYFDFDRR